MSQRRACELTAQYPRYGYWRIQVLLARRFLFDACANGQRLQCLTVIDAYTRERLAIDVAGSTRSGRVIASINRQP